MRCSRIELFDAGNLDDDGAVIPADSPRAHYNRGNAFFHADSAFNPRRASFSLLHAAALPPRSTGGNTDFADSRTAFDDLPPATRADLLAHNYTGAFSITHSRKRGSPDYFAHVDPLAEPMARHKIVQLHAQSGRHNLYIGGHLHHIEGVSAAKSAELIALLTAHATQPKYVYSMAWEQVGDLVAWDNRAVLHRAGEWTGEGRYGRDLRRTTVHDTGPTAWGENEVGMQAPTLRALDKSNLTKASGVVPVGVKG